LPAGNAVDVDGNAAGGGLVVNVGDMMPPIVGDVGRRIEAVDDGARASRLDEEGAVIFLDDDVAGSDPGAGAAIDEHRSELAEVRHPGRAHPEHDGSTVGVELGAGGQRDLAA